MTPRIPEPDPERIGSGAPGTPSAGTDTALPALPGADSDTAMRTAGSTSRRSIRPSATGAPAPAPPTPHAAASVATPSAGGPAVNGTSALAASPDQGPVTVEEAQVEAGIAELWEAYARSHSKAAKDRLVLHYAPLVKYVAGRVGTGLPAHVDVADLIQCGIFGLVDAIERYEPDRGRKFEVYAMQRIRGAILDELRSQDWVPRSVRSRAREIERAIERLESREQRSCTDVELAGELGMPATELRATFGQIAMTSVAALDELVAAGRGGGDAGGGSGAPSLADSLPDASAEDPLSAMESQETRRLLAAAIEHLAERDRTVVGLYYFENLTLAEIGKVLGVTESRVCQLHTRAVMRLRARLSELSHA